LEEFISVHLAYHMPKERWLHSSFVDDSNNNITLPLPVLELKKTIEEQNIYLP